MGGFVNIAYPAEIVVTPQTHVTLVNEYHQVITLPCTDPKTNYGELASAWTQVPRPGLIEPAFLERGPRPLRVITMQVTVVNIVNGVATNQPVDLMLATLTTFLQEATSLALSYGLFDGRYVTPKGTYACTSWQPAVLMRDPYSFNPTQVQGNLVLTEANAAPFSPNGSAFSGIQASPASNLPTPVAASINAAFLRVAGSGPSFPFGGSASTASGSALSGSLSYSKAIVTNVSTAIGALTPPKRVGPATYTVKSGDTLSGIAQKMYGRMDAWRVIAQANNIADPRLLAVGRVLTIPSAATGSSVLEV